MDVFDLTMNKDYYVPLTRKEMIERLEYYKVLTTSFDKKMGFKTQEYYQLLDSLINLEISAFDLNFPSYVMVPSILRDALKYNVWHKTLNVVDKFNRKDIILKKDDDRHGYVKVYESVITDLSLKPPYAFVKPFIIVNSYETDYNDAKERVLELKNKYERLKLEQREYRIEELYSKHVIDENEEEDNLVTEEDEEDLDLEYSKPNSIKNLDETLDRYMKLCEDIETTRMLLNMYRKSLCLYKDDIYKEVAHALMEEYHLPHDEGKNLVKSLPWITFTKKSF